MEPRSETIARHVREAIATDGRLTEKAYAERVMERYFAAVPLHLRSVMFHAGTTSAEVDKAQRANASTINRMLTGEIRMPVDLEEALVDALPDAIRERCIRALTARRGMLPVAMPTSCGTAQVQRAAELLTSTGQAMAALAPMLADGVIDEADRPHAADALDQLRRVIATATSLHSQIESVLSPASVHTLITSSLRRAS